MNQNYEKYYVPAESPWPIVGAIAMFLIAVGAGLTVMQVSGESSSGQYVLYLGIAILIYMVFSWFKNVIEESHKGLYSAQMDRSFKQGMGWFIFSEVMFFMAFFGALFYARMISVPWLGGASNNAMTNEVLWPTFEAVWPLLTTPAGETTQAMGWQGLPLINTLILLTSSVTIHFAHVAIENNKRGALKVFLSLTVLLGVIFLGLQVYEYMHAYQDLGLTLDAGVYGNTFFLLTGFHGMHVTLGTIILFVVLLRIFKGHFTSEKHFAFQAAAWYWHFVDVVWLCLFVFVYVL
ncbi:cytochrome c oxidase subunit 3 [Pseudoalteromonas sp. ACER1]|jgi:cytochrome c oxidase subunit 3|uniref:cytochrome-c oxidase n=1 Tax=Pseudoalteromonas lipolytica TaxID=570156 RepID=A0ABU8SUM4_9GAMM|nr:MULTISPECIES: cytochrome c oxidase subunit 3 [unclassified Pseudoalteromonas]MED5514898.1 cytochrome c oxidase subunit 3 [Pseudomonadota bacterium]MCF2847636.1 cytochrome c oxidase subunit 3 [Pseudoalteromonas sp. PAST1]MCF2917011.1 cytochrome c oxidase subunit 3 [Pseudoalteromonas sp. Cn5-37]MCO7211202.1 cytochrome c oxidase subunit 3 [Pseudoalteromonas sp. ACER1]TMP42648.1 cytochrome c oxidase subunit 3 [Pseudoalteromonas sp. S1650]